MAIRCCIFAVRSSRRRFRVLTRKLLLQGDWQPHRPPPKPRPTPALNRSRSLAVTIGSQHPRFLLEQDRPPVEPDGRPRETWP